MLPQSVKSVLWSYDTNIIDIVADRKLIVSQVLNFGSKEATDWAMSNYGKMGIREVALSIPRGRWNKKSLAFWSLVLNFPLDSVKS
ncbi:MAG: hypothetical protein AAB574_02435 [Patescibacteria group bacterium]